MNAMQDPTRARVVVTGRSAAGTSTVVRDGGPARVISLAGSELRLIQVWGTDPGWELPAAGEMPAAAIGTYLPPPDGSRFVLVELPPESAGSADPDSLEAFRRDYADRVPDLAAAHTDPTNPAMHRTESVDVVLILAGDVELELDAGERVRLAAGDIVIQNGTDHAWHNVGTDRAILAGVLIGTMARDRPSS